MKTKLLSEARDRFQIEHKHSPQYMEWRIYERTHVAVTPLTEWNLDEKLLRKIMRRMILNYCRNKYVQKKRRNK